MQGPLNIAVRAARRAGEVIVRQLDHLGNLQVGLKGRNDYVTEVDHLAEQEIIRTLRRHFPAHSFLGEEGGRQGETDEHVWIIDPLDGTTNFMHGFPVFSVSLALESRGRLEHAVVYDPMRQELFTASRGEGAQKDGRRIRVSSQTTLEGALIGTGFPFRSADSIDAYLAMLRTLMQQTAGIRRPGSAALDLAYVAAGRLDGFWEIGLHPWDTAAGELLIREAGGMVGDFDGGDRYRETRRIVAGNPKIYAALLKTIAPYVAGSEQG